MGGKAIPNAEPMTTYDFDKDHFAEFINRIHSSIDLHIERLTHLNVVQNVVGSALNKPTFNDIDYLIHMNFSLKNINLDHIKMEVKRVHSKLNNSIDFSSLFFISVPYFTKQRTVCQVDLQFVLNLEWSKFAFGQFNPTKKQYKLAHRNEIFFQAAGFLQERDTDHFGRNWFHPNLGFLYGHVNRSVPEGETIQLRECDYLSVVSHNAEDFLSAIFTCNPTRSDVRSFEDVWDLVDRGYLNPEIDKDLLIKKTIEAFKKKKLIIPDELEGYNV